MASRRESNENSDFEVVPRSSGGEYMSIGSAASDDGDPLETRSDIREVIGLALGLKSQQKFRIKWCKMALPISLLTEWIKGSLYHLP